MARYKQKTEAEVAWDRIRREVEYRLNLEAAQQKAEAKNAILPTLQERFEVSLAQGKILSLAEAMDEAGLLKAISA